MELHVIATILALTATSIATTTTDSPPYTPVSVTYSTLAAGGCEAVLSVAPRLTNQVALDCSALATPTVYLTTTTKTVEVECGPCTDLVVQGDQHGCPAIPITTPTTTASVPATSWVYACSQW